MVVCAPFAGVARLQVAVGDEVAAGTAIAVVEAVKLEAPVQAPCPAVVATIAVDDFADVSGGDPLVTLTPTHRYSAGETADSADDTEGAAR
nr:acetyl-CoA carboxylase biotin carboxyl carrier protein subunit [uncultured Corynebacterium sp.]